MSQFLTKLERPKLWDGYPFLLSAVIGDIDSGIKMVVEGFGAAGISIGSQESATVDGANSVLTFNVPEIYGALTNVYYLTVHLETETSETVTDSLTIDVVSPCANPVYLLGRDSLGGCLQWMFDENQDDTFDYGNAKKAERKELTAVNLTKNQWDCLQDFITLGEVYKENIVEFTSSTNRTSVRIGQQIYVVDTDNSKIGVIALPTKNRTRTKAVKHIFELEIEYPEQFTP